MKKTYLLSILAIIGLGTSAQNSISVSNIQSPQKQNLYKTTDSVDIVVYLQNNGPKTIRANDSVYFNYNVATNDTTIFFNETIHIKSNIAPSSGAVFTLHENYVFKGDGFYSVCADASGSKTYPTNISKDPSSCVYFPVSIKKNTLKISQLYYSDGFIHFELPKRSEFNLRIFDINGRLLFTEKLNTFIGKVDCATLIPGMYFIDLKDNKGRHTVEKILIN